MSVVLDRPIDLFFVAVCRCVRLRRIIEGARGWASSLKYCALIGWKSLSNAIMISRKSVFLTL